MPNARPVLSIPDHVNGFAQALFRLAKGRPAAGRTQSKVVVAIFSRRRECRARREFRTSQCNAP